MSEAMSAPLIAVAGSPNCGKTALFNALTGGRQKVANYSGVTVEKKMGSLRTPSGKTLRLLDLPGTYSLDPRTPDEAITRDVLLHRLEDEEAPELLVAVADATNMERSLSLVLELRSLGKPVILALNMMDLAERRGLTVNVEALSRELGVPVVPTIAVKGRGVPTLVEEIEKTMAKPRVEFSYLSSAGPAPSGSAMDAVRLRFAEIDRILKHTTIKKQDVGRNWTDRIDSVVLHPILGSLLLVTVVAVIFQAVFTWAGPLQDGIDAGIGALSATLSTLLPDGPIKGLLVDGIIAGIGSVVIFLPQILFLFAFILLLEDSGYMARAAFLMDRVMGGVGLHGRAFIPLLSSFACAIPGIMATRTIEHRRDRLATILVAPLTTCSARLPVYTLLISAFIPNVVVWGPLKLQGLVMFGLYLLGVGAALLVAAVLRRTLLRGPKPPLILELPTYKVPGVKNLLLGLLERSKIFLRRAGTVILSLSILLWFLATYPKAPEGSLGPAIEYSYAGKIGHAVEPLLRPLGFDWRVSIALIPGFAAREVMVSALGTVYAVEGADSADGSQALGTKLASTWSLATALSLLIWYVFAPQCLSTLAVTRRETNSWLWPSVMLSYMFLLAYVAALLTYQGFRWVGLG